MYFRGNLNGPVIIDKLFVIKLKFKMRHGGSDHWHADSDMLIMMPWPSGWPRRRQWAEFLGPGIVTGNSAWLRLARVLWSRDTASGMTQ